MRLRNRIRIRGRGAAAPAMAFVVALAAAPGAWAEGEGSVMYRCPGNDYKNTISAKDAEKLGCKKLEGAPVSIIQTVRPRTGGTPVPQASAASGARVDPAAQRERDSDARRILETELRNEQEHLAQMRKELNNGQPERRGDEQNYQKYLDRVTEMKAAVARKEVDIGAIQRELLKLPK